MVNETESSDAAPQRTPPLHGRSRTGLQLIIGAVILLSGIVVGSGATILFLKDHIIWADFRHGKRTPAAIADKFRSRYGLTDEQTQKVEALISIRKERLDAIWDEMDQKLEVEQRELMAEMKKVLTPGQYEKWERDFKERVQHHRKRSGPPGHDPDGD